MLVFFVWNVLFLGVKDAVYIFTLILKPVRAFLTSLGIPFLIYLDDAWIGGSNRVECIKNRDISREVLGKAGFVVSKSKAIEPSSRILFLGLEVCSVEMSICVKIALLLYVKYMGAARSSRPFNSSHCRKKLRERY